MKTLGSVSRRQFTAAGLLACAGIGLGTSSANATEGIADGEELVFPSGCMIVQPDFTGWDRETDVLIVGCGGAGASAAIVAQEAGAEVLILEKGDMSGGCTARCGQAIAVGGSDVQAALGIEDSPEDFAEYLQKAGDGDEELLSLIGLKSLESYEWLKGLGVVVPAQEGNPGLTFGGNHDFPPEIPRTHWTEGIWSVLDQQLKDRGIETLLGTPATALIVNANTGEVVGAVAGDLVIKARRAVILAAGGFTNNPQLVRENILSGTYVSFASTTDDGDGISLGQSVGGGVAYMDCGNDTPAYLDPPNACSFFVESSGVPDLGPYIGVNKEAKRFANEYDFQVPINRAIMEQTDSMCYVLVGGETCVETLKERIEPVISSDIGELADAVGLDAETLASTVETWNQYCTDGADPDFGRSKGLVPFEGDVYAIAEVYPGFANTLSGLIVDADMRVLTALNRQPIGRLYAAGNTCDIAGRMYCTCGMAVSATITSGRIAGANAAASDPWE